MSEVIYKVGDVIQSIETHHSPSLAECVETPEGLFWDRFVKVVPAKTEEDVDIVYGTYSLRDQDSVCSCRDWAGIWDFSNYSHRHHYNCEHHDSDEIEVVRVSLDGTTYYEKSVFVAMEHTEEDDDVTLEYMFMSKHNYEELKEFEGF